MRSFMPVRWSLVLVSAVCLTAPTAFAASEGPLRVAFPSSRMEGLDPHTENTLVGLTVLANIYDPLLLIDNDGRQTPLLALSAERSGDRSWRLRLREGVRFHDGSPFSSADVVASILRARDHPRSISRVVLNAVAEVVAEGPYLVRIELNRRDAIFLERLSEIRITPKGCPAVIEAPIGTGPYRFVRSEPGKRITVQAFDGYWGPAPSEKMVEFELDVDEDEALQMLLSNQIDVVTDLEPRTVKVVETRNDLWVDSTFGNKVLFIVLNTHKPPFDNPLVREAFDCAIDRQAIADQIYLKYARPVSQLVAASARGYAPTVPPVARDLTRAKVLISAVAGETGIPFTLEVGSFRESIGRLVAEQLREAGFRVELRLLPGPEVLKDIESGAIQAGIQSYLSPISDAGSTFSYMVHSQSRGTAKTGGSTSEIDRLIEASQDTLDPEARLALLHTIAERLAQRRGFVPLVFTLDLFGARRDLQWKPRTGWGLPLASAVRKRAGT
jgi:peptide/nickel transport system substrate-binding protein